jgi:hypothetical protein
MSADAVAPGVGALPDDLLFPGNYYATGTYFTTDVARGVSRNRAGTRVCALSEDFLRGFHKAITDECGPAADAVFASCGRRWGRDFARRFERELSDFHGKPLRDFSLAMFQVYLVELFSQHGWGRLHLDLSYYEAGLLVLELHEAIMASLVPEAATPVDALTAGVFAGFFQHLTGEDLDCVQIACRACGSDCSRFVVGLAPRLAPVEAWLKAGKQPEAILAELAAASVT